MTDYEIAEQERATLYERIKLVKEEMQSIADPQELAKQKQRYSILYQMYQEALERKDAARPPAERVRTAPKSRVTSFEARSADGTGTFNWLERNHVTFADIEGNTMRWEELGVGLDDGHHRHFGLAADRIKIGRNSVQVNDRPGAVVGHNPSGSFRA